MKRQCQKCGKAKNLDKFGKRKDCVNGRLGTCKKCRNEWQRNYWAKRKNDEPELKQILKDKRHKYYLRHQKQEKVWNAQYTKDHHDELLAKQKKYRKENPNWCLYLAIRNRAKRHNIPFNLEPQDINIPRYCPILGMKLRRTQKHNGDASPSIDRINPRKGYVKGNIIIVSLRANRIKTDATTEEIGKVYRFYQLLGKGKG